MKHLLLLHGLLDYLYAIIFSTNTLFCSIWTNLDSVFLTQTNPPQLSSGINEVFIIPENHITMQDTNMKTAYIWASDLADLSHLKMTLDINQCIHLILDIELEVGCYIRYDLSGSGLFENFETVKEIFFNRIDDLVRHYIPDETNEKYRKSIGLRLWSGCLSAAKTIALETLGGQNTPNMRTEIFQDLDRIAAQDAIYRAGVESAPLLKKKRQQYFSFNGISLTSPVRRYPNEYLIDK